MLLRRAIPVAIAVLALACEPSVPYDESANPASVDYAGFDPTGSPPSIPLPNDLALQPQAIATQNPAQAALLADWAKEGFPNDQEVPITIDFVRESLDPRTGIATRSAPQLDTSSINSGNLIVLSVSSSASGQVAYDPPKPSDHAVNGDHGTLTLHKSPDPSSKSRRWPAGTTIIVAVRGGPNGVKVTNGSPGGLQPQPAMYLLLQDKILTLPENLGIIPGNSRSEKAATAAQLEALRKQYLAPFAAIDATGAFNHREIATMGTFRVAGTTKATHVETDPSAGLMPLPSDFLLGSDGHLLPELAAGTGPFGPAGPGLATLDGFSTTAMILLQTSAPIRAATVKDGVFLYELGLPAGAPPVTTRLAELGEILNGKSPRFVAEPSDLTQTLNGVAVSTAIGLQPAVPAVPPSPLSSSSLATLPPLKEGTTYVVLVSDRVKDVFGESLVRSTLGKILLLDPSISVAANGRSRISGVSDAQAAALDRMRQAVNPAAAALEAEKSDLTRAHLVMAYTFRTQTITGTATQLAALPYAPQFAQACTAAGIDCANPVPGTTTVSGGTGVDAVYDKYGVDPALAHGSVDRIIETKIVTLNLLDPATGAFNPDPTKAAPELIDVLIAVPANANAPTCAGPLAGLAPAKCPPLAIFHHGLGGARTAMLTVAENFAAKGFVVAAIDAPKHGSRTFCSQVNLHPTTGVNISADLQCVPGAHCVIEPSMATQDAPIKDAAGTIIPASPGRCRNGTAPADPLAALVNQRTLCISGTCTFSTLNAGFPAASGQYLVSANFFRTRDSMRQTLIDESQLIRVLGVTPTGAAIAGAAVYEELRTNVSGPQFISPLPQTTGWVGQSLGSLVGTLNTAANPRIGSAVLNAGGATMVDIFTRAPSFRAQVDALFLSLGIDRSRLADATVAGNYLRTLSVAKWILDPADPLNFAGRITDPATTLPNLLPPLGGNTDGSVRQAAKKMLGQNAFCDRTIPNAFNLELEGNAGLVASPAAPPTAPSSGNVQWFLFSGGAADPDPVIGCPAGLAAPHGFFTNWGQGSATADQPGIQRLTDRAQKAAADFLLTGAPPTNLVTDAP